MAEVSRRAVLLGGLGGVAALAAGGVATDLIPGKGTIERLISPLPAGVPDVGGTKLESATFDSRKMGDMRTGWSIAYPPGHTGTGLPVLIALHARGGDHRDAFGRSLHLDRFLADGVRNRGLPPFAIASVDGGDHSYWHPRAANDAAGMVIEEFLPLLAARGLDTSRVGLLGWSMGGYGALYLAGQLGAARVAAAVAESPAIWHEAGQSAAGAFDDAADFEAHSIFGHLGLLTGLTLRIDCGDKDGFAPVTRDLRAALSPAPAGGIESGGHNASYWRSMAPAHLEFVAAQIAG